MSIWCWLWKGFVDHWLRIGIEVLVHRLLRTFYWFLLDWLTIILGVWTGLTTSFVLNPWVWSLWSFIPFYSVSGLASSSGGEHSLLLGLSTLNPRLGKKSFSCNLTLKLNPMLQHALLLWGSSCYIWDKIFRSNSVNSWSIINLWIHFFMSIRKLFLISPYPKVSPGCMHASIWLTS